MRRDNQSVFRYRIRQATKKIVQPAPVVMRGLAGKGDGSTVNVSGMSRYIWVRVNGVRMAVYNNRVTAAYDLPVLVGYDEINPQLLQVLGFDYGAQSDSFPAGFSVPLHGETHRIFSPTGGNDIVWVELRQFLPLSVTASGMDVNIYPGNVPIGNSWVYMAATAVDLTTYVPLTGQCYALIYIDSAGAVQVVDGTPTANPLNLDDIPVLPDAGLAICAVHLYAGQTTIRDSVAATDIIDLRFPGRTSHSLVTLDSDAGAILDLSGQQIGLDTQTANRVLAGPVTGAADEPSFRALVAADVGTGTPDATKFLRDDMSWQTVTTHDAVTLDADAGGILDLQGAGGQQIGLDVQDANKVLAGPTTGAADEPTFRALTLANGDIDDVDVTGDGQGDILYHNAGTYEDYPLGVGIDIVNDRSSIKIGNIADGNYIQIDTVTGEIALAGEATAFEDLRVEPTVRAAAGAGVPSFEKYFDDLAGTSKGVYLYSFTDEAVAGNEKEVFFTMQMPHGWKVGSDISFHVHFVPSATVNSSDIIWGLEYTWKGIGEVFGDTTIVYSSTTLMPDDANITTGKHYIAEFTDLSPGATASSLSSILIGRLFRNSSAGGDTYTNKVGLLYIDAHYQVDSFGSFDEYAKEMDSKLLLESGDILLLETGDKLLTE